MRNSQPSRRASTAPLASPVPRPQENLLHYIVSTRIVADNAAHVVVDLLPIALKGTAGTHIRRVFLFAL